MDEREQDAAETHRIGQAVREEIARRRMSRQALADTARISLSTLEKALAGTRPFTLATIIRIEEALDIRLRLAGLDASLPQQAPDHMGAYSRSAVKWIEGRYLALRPSFSHPDEIFSYVVSVRWHDAGGYLAFEESERSDSRFQQAGHVSMPSLSGHIYLVTNEDGQYRMMVLGRPTIEGTMYGILSTLQVGHGSQLVPVSAPVALVRFDQLAEPLVGRVSAGTPQYDHYAALLALARSEDYVRFY